MNQYLLPILKASQASAWEVTEVRTEGWEFYFIRHNLDQHRVRQVTHTHLKVYLTSGDGQSIGSASCEIHETATEKEISDQVAMLLNQASLVKNPVYSLNFPSPVTVTFPACDVSQMATEFLTCLTSIPETASEDINSYEIFVNVNTRHYMNSNGIDLTETAPDSMLEVVVNARKDDHEIELYRIYTSGTCDREGLLRDITETLKFGRDRLRTSPTPQLGSVPVILSTSAATEVYDYFISRMTTAMKYQRMSDWEIGQTVTDAPLNITACAYLPNSSHNSSFDAEGAPVHDLPVIVSGKAAAFWGSRQFSQYLKLDHTFIASNFRVDGSEQDAQSLYASPCLEVVEFSDFQVDPLTGDIFGEIRLGYLHDENGVTPVSGGSVSGNMMETHLSFSRELRQYDTRLIPAVTRLDPLSITGIQA